MTSQLIERPAARKLLSGPGKGPGRQRGPRGLTTIVGCPVPGCRELIDASRLMCRRDWQLVPQRLRGRVWQTWRSGLRAGSRAHRTAVRLAIGICAVRRAAGGY